MILKCLTFWDVSSAAVYFYPSNFRDENSIDWINMWGRERKRMLVWKWGSGKNWKQEGRSLTSVWPLSLSTTHIPINPNLESGANFCIILLQYFCRDVSVFCLPCTSCTAAFQLPFFMPEKSKGSFQSKTFHAAMVWIKLRAELYSTSNCSGSQIPILLCPGPLLDHHMVAYKSFKRV